MSSSITTNISYGFKLSNLFKNKEELHSAYLILSENIDNNEYKFIKGVNIGTPSNHDYIICFNHLSLVKGVSSEEISLSFDPENLMIEIQSNSNLFIFELDSLIGNYNSLNSNNKMFPFYSLNWILHYCQY